MTTMNLVIAASVASAKEEKEKTIEVSSSPVLHSGFPANLATSINPIADIPMPTVVVQPLQVPETSVVTPEALIPTILPLPDLTLHRTRTVRIDVKSDIEEEKEFKIPDILPTKLSRVDFRHGRGSQYSNREEEELMNRGFVNNQEIAGNFTVMEEALFAIIKDLQKRLEIALKERDHCRDEIRKMTDDFHNRIFLCDECFNYFWNNSELVGFQRNYLTPILEKMNNQEIASNFTVMEEALFAIIKDLQKRLQIALKERDHCRDEIWNLIDCDIYELLEHLCHECIKDMIKYYSENSPNNSEIVGFEDDYLIPIFEKILQGIPCREAINFYDAVYFGCPSHQS